MILLITGLMLSVGLFCVFYNFALALQRTSKTYCQFLKDVLLRYQSCLQQQFDDYVRKSAGRRTSGGGRQEKHGCPKLGGNVRKSTRPRRYSEPCHLPSSQKLKVLSWGLDHGMTTRRFKSFLTCCKDSWNPFAVSPLNTLCFSTSTSCTKLTKPEVRHEWYDRLCEECSEECKTLDVVFSRNQDSSDYEDALEYQAIDKLADSDHLSTDRPSSSEHLEQHSSNIKKEFLGENSTGERQKTLTSKEWEGDSQFEGSEERKTFDVVFSCARDSLYYEDALEEQATDKLADSDHLSTDRPSSSEHLEQHSFNKKESQDENSTGERQKTVTSKEQEGSFAAFHSLKFTTIPAHSDDSQFEAESKNGNAWRTCKTSNPSQGFVFKSTRGNCTPLVEQYFDQLEPMDGEITLLCGNPKEFEKVWPRLRVLDLPPQLSAALPNV